MTRLRTLIAAGTLALIGAPALAQQSAGPGEAAVAPDAAQPDPEHVLKSAYRKEYAFLITQKRELTQRLKQFRGDAGADVRRLEQANERLETQLLALESEAERVNSLLLEAERSLGSKTDDKDILEASLEQAGVTLKDAGQPPQTAIDARIGERVAATFDAAVQALDKAGRVIREPGAFFLGNGARTDGELIHYGSIASFGISDTGSGPLAPAGGGSLKLWPNASDATAKALAANEPPQSLALFLIENRDKSVSDSGDKTALEVVKSGGSIAWVIVLLGGFALALAGMRVVFLKQASSDTTTLTESVGDHLRKRDVGAALTICEQSGGATAKVVAATLRNLDRDPEHLEDIISESILGESGHLDRFGAMILVVAAVAPLLGLLGTVTGMISTFDVITEFGTGDPKLLSGGISVALVTTELGLIVAIPTLFVGNILSGWAERIKDGMEKAALRVTNIYREAPAA